MLKFFGIVFMLVAAGLMISVLPYAGSVSEFFRLPGIIRFFILFIAGAVIYFFGRHREKSK
jgi:hypothetical protein